MSACIPPNIGVATSTPRQLPSTIDARVDMVQKGKKDRERRWVPIKGPRRKDTWKAQQASRKVRMAWKKAGGAYTCIYGAEYLSQVDNSSIFVCARVVSSENDTDSLPHYSRGVASVPNCEYYVNSRD
jgi:hypothetical protein